MSAHRSGRHTALNRAGKRRAALVAGTVRAHTCRGVCIETGRRPGGAPLGARGGALDRALLRRLTPRVAMISAKLPDLRKLRKQGGPARNGMEADYRKVRRDVDVGASLPDAPRPARDARDEGPVP